ncbi:MAG: hypothetical protein NVS1B7_6150 [Candidatus Saccharimonadales bacterium]
MDFLDPKKKRLHNIQLFIGYALMTVVLGFATLVLVNIITFGYDLDRKTGQVIQNGLLFVDAHPESASILLNGHSKGNTGARLTIPAGQYVLRLERSGYRSWQRGFTLDGAKVERFVYPFLFPTRLVTKDVDLFTALPGFATESPDRHWFISDQGNSLTNFEKVDLTASDNTISSIIVSADLFTSGPGEHHLDVVEWASDNRHVLIKHTFGSSFEFVILDHEQPAASLNISKILPTVPIAEIALRDKHIDQVYVLTSTDRSLINVDIKSKQLTLVAPHVAGFKPFGNDQVLFMTTDGAKPQTVTAKLKDSSSIVTLRTLASGTKYILEMAQFNGNVYVAVGSNSEDKIYEYKDPTARLKQSPATPVVPIALLKVVNPQYASFSKNNRFFEVQAGGKFAVYDAETDRGYRYDTKLTLDMPYKASWMDGHRIALLSAGKVVIFDYDGTNVQTLSQASANYEIFFDKDYTALYTVALSLNVKDHTALTRTELKVK